MENTEDGDRWSKRRLHGIGIPTDHRMNTGYGSSNGFNEFAARRDGGAIQLESMYTRGVEKSELERGKRSLLDLSKISKRKKKKKRRNNSQNRQNQFEFGRCDRRHGGTAKEEVSRAGSAFHD